MSDTFNRNSFERQLSASQATPFFTPGQDSATIRQLKTVFCTSGVAASDFHINPFEFNHIQDWFNAVQNDNDQPAEFSNHHTDEMPTSVSSVHEDETDDQDEENSVNKTRFYSTEPSSSDASSPQTDDDVESVRTPLLNPVKIRLLVKPQREIDDFYPNFTRDGHQARSASIEIKRESESPDHDQQLGNYIRALHSSDSTIVEIKEESVSPAPIGAMSAKIDFNHQEPSFEHATDLSGPLPDPSRFPPAREFTPIRERRMSKHELSQLKAIRCINSMSVNIGVDLPTSPVTPLANTIAVRDSYQVRQGKKRSAAEARTPLSAASSPKRARINACRLVIDSIAELLAPTPSAARFSPVPSFSSSQAAGSPPCTASFPAYPGQFHGLTSADLEPRSTGQFACVWGRPRNANGFLAHRRLPPQRPPAGGACPAAPGGQRGEAEGRRRRNVAV